MNKIFIIDDCDIIPSPSGDTCPIKANIIEACDSDNTIILASGSTIFNKTIFGNDLFLNGKIIGYGNSNINGKIFSGTTTGFELVDFPSIKNDDFYTTGATLSNNIISFNRNDLVEAYNVDLSAYDNSVILTSLSAITTQNTIDISILSGITQSISGLTDTYITGGTYSDGTTTFVNNTGGTFSISGYSTGTTQNLQQTTNFGYTTTNPLEHNNGSNLRALLDNDGTIAKLSFYDSSIMGGEQGVYAGFGWLINDEFGQPASITSLVQYDSNKIGTELYRGYSTLSVLLQPNFGDGFQDSLTLYYPKGISGSTNGTPILPTSVNNYFADEFGNINLPTGVTTTDTFVTGGTHSNGISTFRNNTGGTFSISGYSTGYTLTSSGIISVLGYTPVRTDVRVTGGTHSNGTTTFRNSTGGTFNVGGYSTGYTLTAPAIVGTLGYTPYNSSNPNGYISSYIDTNTFVTGATYSAGTATFVNNSGGTFNVSGFTDAFLRNETNPSLNDVITIKQSIFNPSNLTVLNTSIFIVEADADYYVLGDLINNGAIVVNGTLKIGGILYNSGTITGSGIIE